MATNLFDIARERREEASRHREVAWRNMKQREVARRNMKRAKGERKLVHV
jgi:hypothetical protein